MAQNGAFWRFGFGSRPVHTFDSMDGSFIALAAIISSGLQRKTLNHGRRGTTRNRTGFYVPKRETCHARIHF